MTKEPFYQDDAVTLYCGEAGAILPLLPAKTVQLVVTSPQFNIGDRMGKRPAKSDSWEPKDWYSDNLPQPVYEYQQVEMLEALARVLVNGGSVMYNHRPRLANWNVIHPLTWIWQARSLRLVQEIVWLKNGTPNKNCGHFFPTHEFVYWLSKGRPRRVPNHLAMRWTDVWDVNQDTDSKWHPCSFPAAIPGRCIEALTHKGETVLDPYAGSGTTLLEAKKLGRRAIGMEVRADYAEKAAIRLTQCPMFADL